MNLVIRIFPDLKVIIQRNRTVRSNRITRTHNFARYICSSFFLSPSRIYSTKIVDAHPLFYLRDTLFVSRLNLNNTLLRNRRATLEVFRALEEPRRAGTFDECIKVHSSGLDFQPVRYINPSFTSRRGFPATPRDGERRKEVRRRLRQKFRLSHVSGTSDNKILLIINTINDLLIN